MSDSPATSVSQETAAVIDTGAESYSVDATPEIIEGKTGDNPPVTEDKQPDKQPDKPAEETKEEGEPPDASSEEQKTEEIPAKETAKEDVPAGVKKRLATVTRKRHDAERAAAAMQAQNAELLARIEALENPEGVKSAAEPSIEDYDTEEDYLDAIADYRADKIVAERDAGKQKEQEEIAQQQQAEAVQAREGAFRDRLKEGTDKYDDFEDIVEDLNVTGDMLQVLESLPNLPDTVYALGKDLANVDKLNKMPFLDMAYKVKDISNKLLEKKTTKAPAPIKPVSTSGASMKTLENMTMEEYTVHMNKRDKERRGRY